MRLRGRLTCFYCGSRSAQAWKPSLRKFHCTSCEAVNYLDKHGDFVEPPCAPTPEPVRPAMFRPSSTSPSQRDRKPVKFCRTCEHNQLVVHELLKEYLPDESHPRYQQYLDNYETYKRGVEEKYPQCCSDCISMVTEKVMDSAKLARSDHLRRMIERTRRLGFEPAATSWQDMAIWLGKIGWWTSLLLALIWHAISAATATDLDHDYEEMAFASGPIERIRECALDIYEIRQLRPACAPNLSRWIPYGILLAFLSSWWHPLLETLQLRKTHIAVGKKTYYATQALSIGLQALAFYGLGWKEGLPIFPHEDARRALHGLCLVTIILLSWIGRKSMKLERLPPIQFAIDRNAILPDIPRPKPAPFNPLFEEKQAPQFNINDLAPRQPRPRWGDAPAPEAEPEVCNEPSMDWKPEGRSSITALNSFRSRQHPPPNQPLYFNGQTPFHGNLPSAPVAPAYKLRNPETYQPTLFRQPPTVPPPTGAVFGHTSANHAPDFNKQRNTTYYQDRMDDADTVLSTPSVDAEFSRNPHAAKARQAETAQRLANGRSLRSGARQHNMDMAQPTFFAPQDVNRTTGLEAMFGARAFGLRDSPDPSPQPKRWTWRGGL